LKLAVERTFGRLALPHVPVIAFRDRLFRQPLIPARSGIVNRQHHFDLADAARPDQLARKPIHFHRSLLGTDLEDTFVFSSRLDQNTAFGDGQCERLFRIDVQARLTGVDTRQNAAVVRRGNDDCV